MKEVQSTLNIPKDRKALRKNRIGSSTLKHIPESRQVVLIDMINRTLRLSHFPTIQKAVSIVMIRKSNNGGNNL